MKKFSSFLVNKSRQSKEHLNVLKTILGKAGFKVDNHLDDPDDPYLYVRKPEKNTVTFGGIRIYTLGKDVICFRPQNKETTEPFGQARQIDVNSMYKDLIKDFDKDKIGHRIIFHIIQTVKEFFSLSMQADKEKDKDSNLGAAVIPTYGTDYSNTILSSNGR